ncbi:hypothetical protein WJX79_006723 [Trebouxia sp. C0005]
MIRDLEAYVLSLKTSQLSNHGAVILLDCWVGVEVFLGAYLCEHGTVHSPQGDVDGRHARVSLCFLHEQVCEAVVTELHQRRAYVCRYSSA